MSLINEALKRIRKADKDSEPPAAGDGLEPVQQEEKKKGLVSPLAGGIITILGVIVLGAGGFYLWKALRPAGGKPKPVAVASNTGKEKQPAAAQAKETKPAASAPKSDVTATNLAAAPAPQTEPAPAEPAPTKEPTQETAAPQVAAAPTQEPPAADTNAAPVDTNAPSASLAADSSAAAQAKPAEAKTDPAAAPTEPAGAPSEPAAAPAQAAPTAVEWPALKLQAIFWMAQNPTARINGRSLKVGDEINGVKLVAIERDSAKLEFKGETKELAIKHAQ